MVDVVGGAVLALGFLVGVGLLCAAAWMLGALEATGRRLTRWGWLVNGALVCAGSVICGVCCGVLWVLP